MKIQKNLATPSLGMKEIVNPVKPKKTFLEELSGLKEGAHDLSHITRPAEALLSGKKVDPKELIRMQLSVGHYNLKVELVSKLVETLVSTPRRLQQG